MSVKSQCAGCSQPDRPLEMVWLDAMVNYAQIVLCRMCFAHIVALVALEEEPLPN